MRGWAGDVLFHRARATPGRTALVDDDDGETLTYDELDAAVDDLAGRLATFGVDPGDRLGILVGTSVDAVALIHAAWRRGTTLVPLNVRLANAELRRQAARADVDALVCEPSTHAAASAIEDVPLVSLTPTGESHSIDDLGPTKTGLPRRGLDDPRVVMFTSGTTGDPKAVPLTAGNLLASATGSAFRLGVVPDDRWLLCLPIYHMGGLAPVFRSALYGTTVVVQEAFEPTATAVATRTHGATGVSLVPTMLRRVFDADAPLSDTLRFVLLGGAPAPDELIEECKRRDVPVHPTYGSTETASQIATATPDEAFERPGTVGRPLLGTDVTVVDPAGDPVPEGETGEIVVAGPMVTPGYGDGEDQSAFGEYGFHTGDVGFLDDGLLWVTGRLDDLIVTGGENVSPAEVEDVLREHPAVEDAAVVGLDDPEWGERVAALVVADGVSTDGLRGHCRERLAGYKIPRTMALAEELPRTPSGTVDRDAVRERLE